MNSERRSIFAMPAGRRSKWVVFLIWLAVIFFATTPVFIVWADPMDPIVKTWGRMLVAASVVGLAAWLTSLRKAEAVQPEIRGEPPSRWP